MQDTTAILYTVSVDTVSTHFLPHVLLYRGVSMNIDRFRDHFVPLHFVLISKGR